MPCVVSFRQSYALALLYFMPKKPHTGKHYKIVLFYPRAYQPTFSTRAQALNHIKARALTAKAAQYYTEVWEMDGPEDGQMEMLFDYGCTEPEQLVRR